MGKKLIAGLEEACEYGVRRSRVPPLKEGAPREKGHVNVVPLDPSWCCPPGVAVVVGAEVGADAVTWNDAEVAVGGLPVLPPSAPLSRGARGVVALWWGFPPIKSVKVSSSTPRKGSILFSTNFFIRAIIYRLLSIFFFLFFFLFFFVFLTRDLDLYSLFLFFFLFSFFRTLFYFLASKSLK